MRLLISTFLLLLTACYDSAGEPAERSEAPVPSATLTQLQHLFTGKTFEITNDMVVSGWVVSHDRTGNFYRSFIIEDDMTAAEVMAGIDGLHNIYPVGCQVAVNLKGLAVGLSHGVLQIGLLPKPGSGYTTDYIGSRPALDRHLFRTGQHAAIKPILTDIPSLTPERAGCLVRIDGLHYAPDGIEPNEWAGTKRFMDADGNLIYTYTRIYADFAAKEIPSGEVLLVGLLQCDPTADGPMRYTLRLRDENDCWD